MIDQERSLLSTARESAGITALMSCRMAVFLAHELWSGP
jgi:hypothetical protein